MPSGGTSDFIPEMWHSLKKNNTYECFVDADTRIPFLAMPDAIQAINQLMSTEQKKIKSRTLMYKLQISEEKRLETIICYKNA